MSKSINKNTIYDAIRLMPEFESRLSDIRESEKDSWKAVIREAKNNGEISTSMSDEIISRLFISSSKGIHYDNTLGNAYQDIKAQLLELWAELYTNLK